VIYTKARLVQEFPVTFDQARNPVPGFLAAKSAYATLPASSAATQPFESSVLLYLTLNQGRRGQVGFNADEHVEPIAIKTGTAGNVQVKYFVDSWNNPLRYYAFPYYNDELNGPPYRNAFVQNQQSPDPLDPDKVLTGYTANATFNSTIHPTEKGLRTMIAVVASAGRDGDFGDDLTNATTQKASWVWMNLPNVGVNDNIYSYRLRRFGAKGD
jgi:hypothetical protein